MQRRNNVIFWIIAFIITISSAVYQRMTGPTHPIRGTIQMNASMVNYKLARSHGGETDHFVSIEAPDSLITANLLYKRYKTDDPWTIISMKRNGEHLMAALPHQPPAGKLMYRVIVINGIQHVSLTGDEPVIIRFKGAVPIYFLLPHVMIMFLAMLFSNRAGLEALLPQGNPRKIALWTTGFLFIGGIILGPLVQKYAFGQLWTGFPLGTDLTDNKTALAMIAWIMAVIAGRKNRSARWWVLGAAIVLLAIYLIPHSMFGSELDYSKLPQSEFNP